jgi:hypothetical protein
MEPISLETRENLKGLTISALQKMRHNGGLEPFDIDYINKSILAKLRSSREILEFTAELNYCMKINDDIKLSQVLNLFKQAAPFIKGMISENKINLILSQIENDFIRKSIRLIIADSIAIPSVN